VDRSSSLACIAAFFIAALPVALHAQTFTILANLGSANPLVQGSDGNFYGTTSSGGAFRGGTVFTLTPAGEVTILHSFSGDDGEAPTAPLIQATDGNFYGTTSQGGTPPQITCLLFNGFETCGTVFRITPTGALTTLYSFTNTSGTNPLSGLVQGTDGNLYGTTAYGGPVVGSSAVAVLAAGTVFRITTGGALTTLYTFTDDSIGAEPTELLRGTDGNFYGTTSSTVFKITPAGALTSSRRSAFQTTPSSWFKAPTGTSTGRRPTGAGPPTLAASSG
jgi:uncharacterized repeat protein (TIGR03803 family)